MTCSLLHTSYLATCDNITAGYEPDYAQCLAQDSGTCDVLVRENCDLQGSVVWQSVEVLKTYECQKFLQVLGLELGGKEFSYSSEDKVCYILNTGARKCTVVSYWGSPIHLPVTPEATIGVKLANLPFTPPKPLKLDHFQPSMNQMTPTMSYIFVT